VKKQLLNNHYFISFALGAISALAFAPTYLFILAIVGFSGLFLLMDRELKNSELFWLGWCFGFGQFLIGLYWISISLLVDVVKFGWLIPFAISLIPAAIGVYTGLVVLLTGKISTYFKLHRIQKILVFSLLWILFEYLRSILFSGFPWNLLGYTLVVSENISQIASVVGIYGLSLLAIVTFMLPAILFDVCGSKLKLTTWKWNFHIVGGFGIFLLIVSIWGALRIDGGSSGVVKKEDTGVNIRIVQPSIEQRNKWDPQYKYESFMKNIKLSKSKSLVFGGVDEIDYLIWSESAIPYLLNKNAAELLGVIRDGVPDGAFLVSGALRAVVDKRGVMTKVFNSIFVIDDTGDVVDFYDKRHLVPFGEYIPFQKYIPFISTITDGAEGFSSGKTARTIKVKDDLASFGPLICYEVIFPNLMQGGVSRPDFLLNLTNDAWFGRSSGPYQHLAMARVRAIEYGLPLVRAANSGVSALIDPYGRIVKEIGLNEVGVLDVKLMDKLEATIYDRFGIRILFFIIIFIIAPLIINKFTNVSRFKSN
jgi:apolipoprotein N-acyltransferase